MRLSRFLVLLAAAGVVSTAAWVVVLLFIDPTAAGILGLLLFYATLTCAVFAAVVLLGLFVRILLKRTQHQAVVAFHLILPALRQALWCSVIVVISLILASQELFSWFVGAVLILFFSLLEGFFYSLHKSVSHEPTVAAE